MASTTTAAPAHVLVRADAGMTVSLDLDRWDIAATAEEQALLATVQGPVVDLGCGPGRLVVDLAARRIPVLGVDSCPDAILRARRRGAAVIQRDLFGPLPDEGRWATALLFDGNIGIGGDPAALLIRCREVTSPGGCIVAEVDPPGVGWRRVAAWLVVDGRRSRPFPWAVVGADAIAGLAAPAGLSVTELTSTPSGRWFAWLGPTL